MYSNIKTSIKDLKHGDKLKLAKEINEVSDNKLDINHELRKERRAQKAGKSKGKLKAILTGAGIGVLLANLDKETFSLISPLIPKDLTEKIYQSRTLYTDNHVLANNLIPKGLIGGSALVLAMNTFRAIAKSFSSRKIAKQKIKAEGNAKLSDNQKIALQILKNKLIAKHPENQEKIQAFDTLNDLKDYMDSLPKNEQKDATNDIVKLNKVVNQKSKKEKAKEVGKILGNSLLLAGDSMAAYQLLLFLKGKFLFKPNSKENAPEPEPEPAPETVNETVTSPSTNTATQTNPNVETMPAPEPTPNPVPTPTPVPQPVPAPLKPPTVEITSNSSLPNETAVEVPVSPTLPPMPTKPEVIEKIEPEIEVSTEVSGGGAVDVSVSDGLSTAGKVGLAAIGAAAVYWGIKAAAGVATILAPEAAPITVPIIIGG